MADRPSGSLGILGRVVGGCLQRSVSLEDIEYLRVGYAVESTVAENRLNLSALLRRATLERVDDRHGHFSLTQIAGNGLSENAFRRCQIEHIVDDLECHAEIASISPKRVFLFQRRSVDDLYHRPQAHRTSPLIVEQFGRKQQ